MNKPMKNNNIIIGIFLISASFADDGFNDFINVEYETIYSRTAIDYESKVANATSGDIEKFIAQICSMLQSKSEKEECYKIDSMTDKIKNMLEGGMDEKEICYKLSFCNK